MDLHTTVPVLAALAGVIVGGFISEFRNLLELRRERRKALRYVLAAQLNLWSDLKRYDLASSLPILLAEVAKHLNIPPEILAVPSEHQERMGEIIAERLFGPREQRVDEQYEEAVNNLSGLDPLLAYQLSRRTYLVQFRESADSYVGDIYAQFSLNFNLQDANQPREEDVRPVIRKGMLKNNLKLIESDILDVAHELGRSTMKQTRKLLINSDDGARELIRSNIKELSEDFVQQMQSIAMLVSARAKSEPQSSN